MIMERCPLYENRWIYRILMFVGGFYGGYAILMRGGAFSNAQTGNVVYMALELGEGNWGKAFYYLIPITAYMSGSLVSELIPKTLRSRSGIHWTTIMLGMELIAVAVMGFIPATAPHQICQITINFICAMRFQTFRGAEGNPMATIFCTNIIRQIGVDLAGIFGKSGNGRKLLRKVCVYALMLLFFATGVVCAVLSCRWIGTYAVWLNLIPLAVVFAALLRADLSAAKTANIH